MPTKRNATSLVLGVLCLCAALLFTGCGGPKAVELPPAYDEQSLEAAVDTLVRQLNERNYDALYENFSAEMQQAISAKELAAQWEPVREAAGDFISLKTTPVDVTETEGVLLYVTVQTVARYTQGEITFSLSFDPQYQTVGLYFK